MVPEEVWRFGEVVVEQLRGVLAEDLVGAWFVGSIALGGYVRGESDIDVVVACEQLLPASTRGALATAVVDATPQCPARGLELTVYRRAIASSTPEGADFEVNANGAPRMDTCVRTTADGQPAFWYVLDRAIAHRHGVGISPGFPPASSVFADVGRAQLLGAMRESMRWHRAHERATLYSVLNAARAWRFAEEGVLGSKLEGADWARTRWTDVAVIDAAVALRRGRDAHLDEAGVDALLDHVERALSGS